MMCHCQETTVRPLEAEGLHMEKHGVCRAIVADMAQNIGNGIAQRTAAALGKIFIDMQGDRLVGKETIPILLGEKQSMRLLKIMLMVLSAILVISSAFQLTSSLGFFLIICPLLISIIIFAYERALMFPGIRLEFLLETQFLAAGVISFGWVWIA